VGVIGERVGERVEKDEREFVDESRGVVVSRRGFGVKCNPHTHTHTQWGTRRTRARSARARSHEVRSMSLVSFFQGSFYSGFLVTEEYGGS